jgi:hypothetical protein
MKTDSSFATSVDDLLNNAGLSFGEDLKKRTDLLNGYKKHLQQYIKKGEKYTRLMSILNIILLLLPAFAIAFNFILKKVEISDLTFWVFWTGYLVAYILFSVFKILLPSDEESNLLKAKLFNMENIAHRLSAQVTLYNSLDDISHNDNSEFIKKFSSLVQSPVEKSITENFSRVKKLVDPEVNCADFKLTKLEIDIELVSKSILNELSFIAERINDSCTVIFGRGGFTTKIYIRTKHNLLIDNEELNMELLTAMGRHPQSKNSKFGKSWVNPIKGAKARVWNCINDNQVSFVEINEDKGSGSGRHPSILYLALPGSVGVLTISSDHKDTFKHDNGKSSISSDIEHSLMNATTALLSKMDVENMYEQI